MVTDKKNNSISWIYRMMKRRIPSILCLSFIQVFSAYLGVRFALVTQNVIDSAVGGNRDVFLRACLILAVFILVRIVCNALATHMSQMVRANLDRDFKRNILHKIYHSEYADISKYHSADLVHRMNTDGAAVYGGVLTIFTSLASYLTTLATAVITLMSLEPVFTLAMGLGTAAITLMTALIQRRMKKLHKESSEAGSKVSGFLHESINRLMLVQALDVSDEMERRAEDVLEYRWQVVRRRKNVSLVMSFGSSGLGFLGGFVTLLWCSSKLMRGEITYGGMSALSSLVAQLQTPLMMLPHIIPQITAISAACERLMEIERIAEQPKPDETDVQALYDRMNAIRAKDLTFSYDRDPVIQNVSLTIPKGGLTVIVGQSGIGKSTLLKLLLGLYRPDSGELVIDTEDGAVSISRAARSLFSYAPQGNFLLSGTLRENLVLTNPNATDEQIAHALYVGCMEEYVASLPQGLDTPLGENGAGLSEGQAQRLSLARAILSGAPVLLLDEVTSSLDAATEQTVLERICALPGKTCIAVTHRPAALALADSVIEVTEDGMVLRACTKCG